MRRSMVVAMSLLAITLAGCLTGQSSQTSSHYPPDQVFQGLSGDDVVELCSVLVERPAGDRYLNGEAWQLADEQQIGSPDGADPELLRKRALEDNGFRVGQIGGLLPPRLQNLVESGRSNDKPRCLRLKAGIPTTIVVGPIHPRLRFHGSQDDPEQNIDLTKAQCEFQVTPFVVGKDRVRLLITPVIHHGEPDLAPRPLDEPDGTRSWDLQSRQAAKTWDALTWSLTLGGDEVALVGPQSGAETDRLGHGFFLQAEGQAVQRLLMLRARRCPAEQSGEDAGITTSPALRAVRPAVGSAKQ